jgi:single-strand DNA-binding protein
LRYRKLQAGKKPALTRRVVMNNLNSILIEGNLVKDPMLRSTPRGTQVCTLRLASNRFFKQDSGFEKEVSFFDVETWARLAEACYAKGKKGRGIRVVGRLKQDRWTGPDGKPFSRIRIVAEHVEFRPEFRKDQRPSTGAGTNVVAGSVGTAAGTAAGTAMNPASAIDITEMHISEMRYESYPDEEIGEPVLAMVDKELEAVTF